MVLAMVVVMLGVAWVVADGVILPFSASMGVVVSTPVKAWTPPTVKLAPATPQV